MLVWFVVLGPLGIHGIAQAPGVLVAVTPLDAFDFLIPWISISVSPSWCRLSRGDRR